MKFDCQFKSLDHSQALVEHTETRLSQKLEKYELKPMTVHVVFSRERHEKVVEVRVKGLDSEYFSKAKSDSYEASVDKVVHKLMRQLDREKRRVQNHRLRVAS